MKIIFFGNPEFCLLPLLSLYNSDNDLLSVVTNIDRKSGRGLKLTSTPVKQKALELNIPIIETDNVNSEFFFNKLNNINVDLFVVVAFSMLPENIINIPKYGSVNIHPSLLPRYRGSSPIQYALLNGDKDTGVSIISLNSKIDAGGILGQEKMTIPDYANFGYMYQELSLLGSELLIKVISNIKNNKSKLEIQNETLKTLAPKIKKEQYKINWSKPLEQILNQIKAFDPMPGAYAIFKNKRIKLFGAKKEEDNYLPDADPGCLFFKEDILLIKTITGYISVTHVHLEGKKIVNSKDFIKTLNNKEYLLD